LEEKVIKIESIDPKDFFGPQNKNIKVLKSFSQTLIGF